jgi:diguanylate cyclase (GGDEF)-like protein
MFDVNTRLGQRTFGPLALWSFAILPAWWQTWWFWPLAVLAAVAVIAWLVRWRTGALRRQNLLLEATVTARTAELHAANEQLRDQSLTDPLTGMRNRRYLGTCMVEDSAQARRRHVDMRAGRGVRLQANIDILFLMIDLDHFKKVNDTYGHQTGDKVLKQAAEVIRSATRNSDTVVRWGGEEFLVVGRGTSRQFASTLVERIRSAMERYDFAVGPGQTIHVTCSVGFAYFPMSIDRPDLITWELVVNLADQCMYAVKRSGRNGWVGLVKAEGLSEGAGADDISLHLEDHIASGVVQMIHSRPPGTQLEWTLPTDRPLTLVSSP